jgi:para-aminobenzoate synthetase component 1
MGREPGVVYLDSGGKSPQARWSILGWGPGRVVAWPQGRAGAFEQLRKCFPASPANEARPGTLPFRGGWIGWFSYDLGRHVESLPSIARADPSIPDFVIGDYDMVLVEDHANGALWAAGRCRDAGDERRIEERAAYALGLADNLEGERDGDPSAGGPTGERGLAHHLRPSPSDAHPAPATPQPLTDRSSYERSVRSILEHIEEGSIYQANFSHRFAARTTAASRRLYEALRDQSPAPFACYLGLPEGPEIFSASPELFLRKTGSELRTHPIKGTRPRDVDPSIDARLREELRESEKERAELLMITDLMRNDLGRVATYGSVRVETLRALESHPTVHHTHSEITAHLRDGLGVADILAATMPGGSVTGAPKIRAMEILDELEAERRGPYTGAAGYIGDDGDMCLNILIRTLVRQGADAWYQVGGGIVADSDPAAEYDETLAKGAALRRALTLAG